MKKIWISMLVVLSMSAGAWALTATGMPALDDLLADVKANGPLSQRLGFTEDQRENIEKHIEKASEDLVKLRDANVAAEKKVDRKDRKDTDKTAAVGDQREASAELNAARNDAFLKLQPLMSEKQFEELKKWRAEGKDQPNVKSDKKDADKKDAGKKESDKKEMDKKDTGRRDRERKT